MPFTEMESNIRTVLKVYKKYAPEYNSHLFLLLREDVVYIRYFLSSLKMCVKEMLFGFKQTPVVNA